MPRAKQGTSDIQPIKDRTNITLGVPSHDVPIITPHPTTITESGLVEHEISILS